MVRSTYLPFEKSRVLTPIQPLDLAMLDGLRTALVDHSTSCSLSGVCYWFVTVFKIIYIHRQLTDGTIDDLLTPVLYASFSLATTLWCTLLIIYRVWTVGRTNERGLEAYRHVVEVLIESSALCSVSLILFVAFFSHNDWTANYLDPITGIARGVAPTLLVGRVAAGHPRPDDSWEGSIMTSLRFWQGRVQASAQEGTLISISLYDDVEAQSADDEHGSQEDDGTQRVALDDNIEARREKVDYDLSTTIFVQGRGTDDLGT
ncbi:uncharacterized protein ARMOST_17030 [Armillaria ostoyae]|uniref:Uncharacterized protein n=1 Tax=Armillaria ostoyae TaxID=47428 RepID=A0A284RXV4_ARMOS|nr:uncharacterized protein ARMOST_17030 [Armillaria ostoyae]